MRQVAITLNGRVFRLGCGEGEEARLKELSDYLAAKIEALRSGNAPVGDERLLVMAAILVTDELFEARERISEGAEAAGRRSTRRGRAQAPRPMAGLPPEPEPPPDGTVPPPGEERAA
jgi:cell division protein ZapA